MQDQESPVVDTATDSASVPVESSNVITFIPDAVEDSQGPADAANKPAEELPGNGESTQSGGGEVGQAEQTPPPAPGTAGAAQPSEPQVKDLYGKNPCELVYASSTGYMVEAMEVQKKGAVIIFNGIPVWCPDVRIRRRGNIKEFV